MPKLTSHFVEDEVALPANSVVNWIRDSELAGFGLRVSSTSKTYFAERKVKGKTRRITLGKHPFITAEAARKKALQILGQMASGFDPIEEKERQRIANVTLEEALVEYMASREFRPNTVYSFNRVLRKNLCDWLHQPVTAITKQMVLERFKQIGSGSKGGGTGHVNANLTMQVLRAVLNYASVKYSVDGQLVLPENPVSVLSQLKAWYKIPPRTGIIPDNKLADWHQAVCSLKNPISRDYYLVLLLTGLRKNEAAKLRWNDVDLEARIIIIRPENCKSMRAHKLPLSGFLMDIFRRRFEHRRNEWVFPAWRTALGSRQYAELFKREKRL